jgi:hypothetical protein
MSVAINAVSTGNIIEFQSSQFLSAAEIDNLLVKLARGHLSTMQEEYADLKKMICGV